ncbi:MAG: SDR family oxidoreductase [Bacilli bacterium]
MRKTVLITGASDGVGKQLAILLSKEFDLIICGRRQEKLNETVSKLDKSCSYYASAFDITDRKEQESFLNYIKEHYDSLFGLVNNAGANIANEEIKDMSLESFERMMNLNCYAPLLMIQGVYSLLKKESLSHIVNIHSTCCLYSNSRHAGYSASKSAFESLCKILVKEAKNDNILVSNIYPGGIDSNFRTAEKKEYLRPLTVAKAIETCLKNDDGSIQQLVLRPSCEDNFA